MIMAGLEASITEGMVALIGGVDYSPSKRRLTLTFIREEAGRIACKKTCTFLNVYDYSDEHGENRDENDTDSLIGLDEYSEKDQFKYVIRTETREIIFRTNEAPHISIG